MKLSIASIFLLVAVAVALPVEETKQPAPALAPALPPGGPPQAAEGPEELEPTDDLKTDATFWGWGKYYRPYYSGYSGYGRWGGYYQPSYYSGWNNNYGWDYPSYGYRHYSYWG